MKALTLLPVFILLFLQVAAQKKQFPVEAWAKKLNVKDDTANNFLQQHSWHTLRNYCTSRTPPCVSHAPESSSLLLVRETRTKGEAMRCAIFISVGDDAHR